MTEWADVIKRDIAANYPDIPDLEVHLSLAPRDVATEWANAPTATETLAAVQRRLSRIVEDAFEKWDDYLDDPASVEMGFSDDDDVPGVLILGWLSKSAQWSYFPWAWDMHEGQKVTVSGVHTPDGWDTYVEVQPKRGAVG